MNCRHMNAPSMSIIPVHSKLSSEEQKAIFKPLRKGIRKVILSTNIAETSLTVPDVVYVIDPGLCNETYYHKEYNVSTFGTHLISQANAKQREGRAGRVKPGVCYKLYTKETEVNSMTKYFVPEMLRIPLETVVMFSKLYCPNEQAVDFLANALEPPSTDAILSAVNTLKLISVLDSEEHLTLLGRKVVDLSTHPRLSVSLVTSAMLASDTPGPIKWTRPYFDCGRSNKWIVGATVPIPDIFPRHTGWRHIEIPIYVAVALIVKKKQQNVSLSMDMVSEEVVINVDVNQDIDYLK
ncbi:hypothetical protein RND71_043632 [Anisodus tanguticus]|uniref:RNA helicase n=1 Tax=Anisodus tanguticus TaxID=243964 RepID=A0AAE1UR00_9SOLA|nr:hypothetical protein RND71_043632 [Anisodus tanguticus]